MNKNRMDIKMEKSDKKSHIKDVKIVKKDVLFDKEDFKKISKEIDNSKGYMLGITIITNDNFLKHYLVANNFEKVDMLKSLKRIKALVIADLERESQDDILLNEVNLNV